MNELVIITGVRPQYIKAATLTYELQKAHVNKSVIHIIDIGQHYSPELSKNIISELNLKINFKIIHKKNSTAIQIIANSLIQIEKYLESKRIANPTFIVLGDANPALVGGIVGLKMGSKIVHIEAGARRNPYEQEHANSRLIDSISDLRLCVTPRAVKNLEIEGCKENSILTGDMAWRWYNNILNEKFSGKNGIKSKKEVLVSIHRTQNIRRDVIQNIFQALERTSLKATWIIHPRTKDLLKTTISGKNIKTIEPLTFFSVISKLSECSFLITDSGGLAREAHYFKKPVLMRRDNSGWPELKELGVLLNIKNEIPNIISGIQWAKKLNKNYPNVTPFYFEGGINLGIKSIIDISKIKNERYV